MSQTERLDASPTDEPVADEAASAFSVSVLVSAVRCTLTYVVFPWLLPLLHIGEGIGPGIGIVVGVIAIASNVFSIRRFQRSDHRWKWPVTALNAGIIALLSVLMVIDISDVLG